MITINVKTIPSDSPHRCNYSTAGDWWWEGDTLNVCVTDFGDSSSEWAIAAHEITEALDCRRRGITELDVSAFDAMYEQERSGGLHKDMDEPGDDPQSPYRESHQRATHVERAVCHALDLLWDAHQGEVESHVL